MEDSRTLKVIFESGCEEDVEIVSTDKRYINSIAKKELGRVFELINNSWKFLGHYTYEDAERDCFMDIPRKEWARKWVRA